MDRTHGSDRTSRSSVHRLLRPEPSRKDPRHEGTQTGVADALFDDQWRGVENCG